MTMNEYIVLNNHVRNKNIETLCFRNTLNFIKPLEHF